jgi:hypothetical protein
MKMTSSDFLADVVRLGLVRGALQVKMKDLRHTMEALGRTTRSQVHKQEYCAESARAALTGIDTFKLGGGSFGRDFMHKLCTLPGGGVKPLEERPPSAGAIESAGAPKEVAMAMAPPGRVAIIPLLTPPIPMPDIGVKEGERSPSVECVGVFRPSEAAQRLDSATRRSVRTPLALAKAAIAKAVKTALEEEGICTMVEKQYSISPQASPISNHVFKAGTPIAAYNSVGSNLVPIPPASRPRMAATWDIGCYWGVGPNSPAAHNANESSGSGLPKEGQPVSCKHSRQTALNSPPLVKSKRGKPLSDHYSLTYP